MRFPIFLALALASTAVLAQAPQKLVSPPDVDLPFGEPAFPDGPDVEAINTNCLACHSVDHVLNQPSLTREGWEEVVKKMVRAYKAPISAEDQAQIVTYLTATKGRD